MKWITKLTANAAASSLKPPANYDSHPQTLPLITAHGV